MDIPKLSDNPEDYIDHYIKGVAEILFKKTGFIVEQSPHPKFDLLVKRKPSCDEEYTVFVPVRVIANSLDEFRYDRILNVLKELEDEDCEYQIFEYCLDSKNKESFFTKTKTSWVSTLKHLGLLS